MKFFRITLALGLAIICAATLFSSCVKKTFDTPPTTSTSAGGGKITGTDPNLTVSTSFGNISAMGIALGGGGYRVLGDSTISGIVVANDSSGNLYDEIVVEDTTGGISIAIKQYDLYLTYRTGDKVYIKLKGLYLLNYKGTPELCASVNAIDGSAVSIPSNLVNNYIISATHGNPYSPLSVSLLRLSSSPSTYVNRLVTISDAQFPISEAGVSQYTPSPVTNGQLTIEDCAGGNLELYTSNYSYFRGATVPQGQGNITGIYTLYGTTGQLQIRDSSDVAMHSARCGAVVGLDSILKLSIPRALGAYVFRGVVIASANDDGNWASGNMIVQSINAAGQAYGIDMYYGSANLGYHIGDSLEIDVTGDSLTTYAGATELVVTASQILKVGTVTPHAQVYTLPQIKSGIASSHSNTLVQIAGLAPTVASVFSGSHTIYDASSNSVALYTKATATFANNQIPLTRQTYTGVITSYAGAPELTMRTIADIK